MPYKLSRYPDIILSDDEYEKLHDAWSGCSLSPFMGGLSKVDFQDYVKQSKEQQMYQKLYGSNPLPQGVEYIKP